MAEVSVVDPSLPSERVITQFGRRQPVATSLTMMTRMKMQVSGLRTKVTTGQWNGQKRLWLQPPTFRSKPLT